MYVDYPACIVCMKTAAKVHKIGKTTIYCVVFSKNIEISAKISVGLFIFDV